MNILTVTNVMDKFIPKEDLLNCSACEIITRDGAILSLLKLTQAISFADYHFGRLHLHHNLSISLSHEVYYQYVFVSAGN